MELTPGARFGSYTIMEELGAGGMGVVWEARDERLERQVALKRVAAAKVGDDAAQRQLVREARLAASLTHPFVCQVFDVVEEDREITLVLERVSGETLAARLARGPLDPFEAAHTCSEIAEALAEAHALGLVHRDLKPTNVMLTHSGHVKVMDFGLARRLPLENAATLARDSTLLRGAGTPGYMAPEQALGQDVGPAADVFALGVMLFELLTGQNPFAADNAYAAAHALLSAAPPQPPATIPAKLAALITAMLERDPLLRRVSMAEVHRQLAEFARPGVASALDSGIRVGEVPSVRYARSSDVNIAYQVVGQGPLDLVLVSGWVSNVEKSWQVGWTARWLRRLAASARLIMFDKRGVGMSDRVSNDRLPELETRMDDVRAVMEAAGSHRAVLMGVSEGGPMCALFGARYPERTVGLILYGTYARRLWAPDYPWGPNVEERQKFYEFVEREWGGEVDLKEMAPSVADDEVFRREWSDYCRASASPGAAVTLARMNSMVDIRAILPTICVPTLVLHRSGDRDVAVGGARYMAALIPRARYVELPGDDHLPYTGDTDRLLAEIERFLHELVATQHPSQRIG